MRPPIFINSPQGTILFLSLVFLLSAPQKPTAQEALSQIQAKQGEVVYLTVKLEPGAHAVVGQFLNQPIPFFKTSQDEFGALIGIDLAQPPGPQSFEVTWKEDEATGGRTYSIEVVSASFGEQTLRLPKAMVDLDPPTLARVEKEKQRMLTLFSKSADQKLWEGDFLVPTEGKVLGAFGLRRIMNGQARNQHTGEDISAPMGSPVLASNRGKVVLVGDFYFNGRSVVIDHGMGLFSMYFHLSEISVEEGEMVTRGRPIGSVGQSGRATGPHLHWGTRLNGARVNPFSLVEKKFN